MATTKTEAKKVVKETVKPATKAAEVKADAKVEATKAPAKKAAAKTEVKAAPAKKAAAKTEAKTAPAKKAAAKTEAKAAPAKKAPAKKATSKVVAQFNGFDVDLTNIVDDAKKAYATATGKKAADAKEVEVYVNSTGVYAVVNGEEIGKIK